MNRVPALVLTFVFATAFALAVSIGGALAGPNWRWIGDQKIIADWGAWEKVDSQVTNIYGDGGSISQPPDDRDCEVCVRRSGDVCMLKQTGTYPLTPVGTCSLAVVEGGTTGEVLQASTGCFPHPAGAVTPSNDAGPSDAAVYTLESITGTPVVSFWRRCRR